MSTTSTNFSLVLATTSDIVSVVAHIATNFSSLDSIISIAHTGTGQHKANLPFTTPTLINPVVSGTATGGSFVGSTGFFQTITATGGSITASTFAIGTYPFPATLGSSADVLTVSGTAAVWLANAPGTGANAALGNLASVAINTSIGTGSGGFFTFDRVIATSGALTGLTSFQATTGTFAGNVIISGTATINAVNCTGGAVTGASIGIGTWSLPATIGSTNQVLTVTTGNSVWASTSPGPITLLTVNTFTASGGFGATPFTIARTCAVGESFRLLMRGSITSGGSVSPVIHINSNTSPGAWYTHIITHSGTTGTASIIAGSGAGGITLGIWQGTNVSQNNFVIDMNISVPMFSTSIVSFEGYSRFVCDVPAVGASGAVQNQFIAHIASSLSAIHIVISEAGPMWGRYWLYQINTVT